MYKLIGGDGKEYSARSIAELAEWASEGRLTHDTLLRDMCTEEWKKASDYPELKHLLGDCTRNASVEPPVVHSQQPQPEGASVADVNVTSVPFIFRFGVVALGLIAWVLAGVPASLTIGLIRIGLVHVCHIDPTAHRWIWVVFGHALCLGFGFAIFLKLVDYISKITSLWMIWGWPLASQRAQCSRCLHTLVVNVSRRSGESDWRDIIIDDTKRGWYTSTAVGEQPGPTNVKFCPYCRTALRWSTGKE